MSLDLNSIGLIGGEAILAKASGDIRQIAGNGTIGGGDLDDAGTGSACGRDRGSCRARGVCYGGGRGARDQPT